MKQIIMLYVRILIIRVVILTHFAVKLSPVKFHPRNFITNIWLALIGEKDTHE